MSFAIKRHFNADQTKCTCATPARKSGRSRLRAFHIGTGGARAGTHPLRAASSAQNKRPEGEPAGRPRNAGNVLAVTAAGGSNIDCTVGVVCPFWMMKGATMRTLLTAVSLAALGCGVAFGETEQSIDCGVLKKESNGNWSAATPTTITLDG